jgi:hypothetical protein
VIHPRHSATLAAEAEPAMLSSAKGSSGWIFPQIQPRQCRTG